MAALGSLHRTTSPTNRPATLSPPACPWALTSTLHWQLEPVTRDEGLCTPSLARSHTA